jgi:hypothetical protein
MDTSYNKPIDIGAQEQKCRDHVPVPRALFQPCHICSLKCHEWDQTNHNRRRQLKDPYHLQMLTRVCL